MVYHQLHPELIEGHQPLEVHIAGAGGNGSQMLTGLARMHIALQSVGHPGLRISLFDPDLITDANIGRQLFSPADIGKPKAQILVHRVNCYYGFNWAAYVYPYDRQDEAPAILVGCVDSIAARKSLAKSDPYYWLDLGNLDRTGQIILGSNPDGPLKDDPTRPKTFFELFPELDKKKVKEDNAPSCSLAAALERQDLFINQAVCTWALQLLWNFIRAGRTAIQGYFINLDSGKTAPIPITELKQGKPLVETLTKKKRK